MKILKREIKQKQEIEHLLKLLSQVIDFSENRVVMGNERILHEEIIKILKESEKIA